MNPCTSSTEDLTEETTVLFYKRGLLKWSHRHVHSCIIKAANSYHEYHKIILHLSHHGQHHLILCHEINEPNCSELEAHTDDAAMAGYHQL